ncbi:PIN domain-containing protein [Anaerobiospirillum sp. NML120449]|uniref:PIN domain-containing protein n=1 Tax=Anaerobiospirillum sp. NML120449 TaxID=2932817 RepID=UPI001FF3463F|nr:PIN domain-containing protein [Anaerobiospirillum sp. NML120449]MCK0527401.1 PIN domain-containing protein [Anaerobiospirillum sp. NML120449]
MSKKKMKSARNLLSFELVVAAASYAVRFEYSKIRVMTVPEQLLLSMVCELDCGQYTFLELTGKLQLDEGFVTAVLKQLLENGQLVTVDGRMPDDLRALKISSVNLSSEARRFYRNGRMAGKELVTEETLLSCPVMDGMISASRANEFKPLASGNTGGSPRAHGLRISWLQNSKESINCYEYSHNSDYQEVLPDGGVNLSKALWSDQDLVPPAVMATDEVLWAQAYAWLGNAGWFKEDCSLTEKGITCTRNDDEQIILSSRVSIMIDSDGNLSLFSSDSMINSFLEKADSAMLLKYVIAPLFSRLDYMYRHAVCRAFWSIATQKDIFSYSKDVYMSTGGERFIEALKSTDEAANDNHNVRDARDARDANDAHDAHDCPQAPDSPAASDISDAKAGSSSDETGMSLTGHRAEVSSTSDGAEVESAVPESAVLSAAPDSGVSGTAPDAPEVRLLNEPLEGTEVPSSGGRAAVSGQMPSLATVKEYFHALDLFDPDMSKICCPVEVPDLACWRFIKNSSPLIVICSSVMLERFVKYGSDQKPVPGKIDLSGLFLIELLSRRNRLKAWTMTVVALHPSANANGTSCSEAMAPDTAPEADDAAQSGATVLSDAAAPAAAQEPSTAASGAAVDSAAGCAYASGSYGGGSGESHHDSDDELEPNHRDFTNTGGCFPGDLQYHGTVTRTAQELYSQLMEWSRDECMESEDRIACKQWAELISATDSQVIVLNTASRQAMVIRAGHIDCHYASHDLAMERGEVWGMPYVEFMKLPAFKQCSIKELTFMKRMTGQINIHDHVGSCTPYRLNDLVSSGVIDISTAPDSLFDGLHSAGSLDDLNLVNILTRNPYRRMKLSIRSFEPQMQLLVFRGIFRAELEAAGFSSFSEHELFRPDFDIREFTGLKELMDFAVRFSLDRPEHLLSCKELWPYLISPENLHRELSALLPEKAEPELDSLFEVIYRVHGQIFSVFESVDTDKAWAVMDTNYVINNADRLADMAQSRIIAIPDTVLNELDAIRHSNNKSQELKDRVAHSVAVLNSLKEAMNIVNCNKTLERLLAGVSDPSARNNDDLIIAAALRYMFNDVVFYTKDRICGLKAQKLGLKTSDY